MNDNATENNREARNKEPIAIPMSQVLDLVGSLLRYPFPTICRHSVAGDLLHLLACRRC